GRVEARFVADPYRRRATGVQHAQHAPVAFGAPGTHHDVGTPGAGPPVDGSDVVAEHVLAQRVELGTLPAPAGHHGTVQDAQPGQLLGQEPAGREPWQYPDRPLWSLRDRAAG